MLCALHRHVGCQYDGLSMSTLGAKVVDPPKHLRCLDGGFLLSTMF